jgi:dephospho-CoA kinase
MHTLNFVIGASGSGKTAAVRELERTGRVNVFHFDSIGVPAEQEMIERWGSGEGWQRAMTIEWVRRIRPELARAPAVLDGQTRPSFIAEACDLNGVTCCRILLIICSDDVRRARLLSRGQPEFANAQMMEWARYLVAETTRVGGTIINNDDLSIEETASMLAGIVGDDGTEIGDVRRGCWY